MHIRTSREGKSTSGLGNPCAPHPLNKSLPILNILLSSKAFVVPRIFKCLGYRYTFLLGVLLFGSMSVTFPFANRITGPIEDDFVSTMDAGSGSGINSSELLSNTSIIDELDYCGNNVSSAASENLVNENSVKRVPAKVWITLMLIVGVWLTSQ